MSGISIGIVAEFAAHLDHRGRAEAQQRGQAVFHADPLILEGEQIRPADALRGPVIEEARAEQVAPPAIDDHPVAGLRTDMDMGVDETGNDEIAASHR